MLVLGGVNVKNFALHKNDGRLLLYTLPETNIAPQNMPSQKETSIPTVHFQVLC